MTMTVHRLNIFVDLTSRNKHDDAVASLYSHYLKDARVFLARGEGRMSPVRRVMKHIRRFREIWRADHLHFFTGKGPIPIPTRNTWLEPLRFTGLRLLKWTGKTIFLHYQGCDLRYYDPLRPQICGECPLKATYCGPQSVKRRRNAIDKAVRHADAIFVSTPDLIRFVPQTETPVAWFPKVLPKSTLDAIIAAKTKKNRAKIVPRRQGVRFIHAPSARGVKGTDRVLAAVDALKDRGEDVDLVLIEKMPRNAVFEHATHCDVALDQFNVGFYGTFCLEMMMIGLPVCVKIDDTMVSLLNEIMGIDELPLINSGVNYDLSDTLAHICANYEEIKAQHDRTRDIFLRNVHSVEGVQLQRAALLIKKTYR